MVYARWNPESEARKKWGHKYAITSKHRESKVTFEQKHQARKDDMFKEKDEVDTIVSDLQIMISMALARHSVPFTFTDCLSDILKEYVTDSEIVQKCILNSNKTL